MLSSTAAILKSIRTMNRKALYDMMRGENRKLKLMALFEWEMRCAKERLSK